MGDDRNGERQRETGSRDEQTETSRVVACTGGGDRSWRRVREEEAAGRAADSAAAARDLERPRNRPPAPPTPVTEPRRCRPSRSRPTRCRRRDIDDINKNSPFQPVFFAFDRSEVDAARPAGAERQRGDDEEVPDAGSSRSRGTPTSAARRNTIWRSASGGRWRRATTWCRSASRPTACAPSATARSSRSIPATTRGVVEEPARAFRGHEQVDSRSDSTYESHGLSETA